MRGGTANCTVCLSDDPIASPYIEYPDYLVAMNQLSFNKYISVVEKGGVVIYDQAMINGKTDREDLTLYGVDAVTLAEENGVAGLANMILIGKVFQALSFCTFPALEESVKKCVPASKTALIELNMKAIRLGIDC